MKTKKTKLSLLLMFAFSALILRAQPPPPQGGSTGAPMDSGAFALLLGTAIYGYKKLKQREVPVVKAEE